MATLYRREREVFALNPGNAKEFEARFGTEEKCRAFLFRTRWPDGFRCPACGSRGIPVRGRELHQCVRCRRQTSLIAGTIFERTRHPLLWWFRAAYHMARGCSARELASLIGLTYKTAWAWMHKLRSVMPRGITLPPPVLPAPRSTEERLEQRRAVSD